MIIALSVELHGKLTEHRRFKFPGFVGDAPQLVIWEGQIYRLIPPVNSIVAVEAGEVLMTYVLEVVFSPASNMFVDQVFEPFEVGELIRTARAKGEITEREIAMQSFALAFKATRRARGMTLGGAADALGVRVSSVSAWEHALELPRPGLVEKWQTMLEHTEGVTVAQRDELLELWTSAFTTCRGCGCSYETCRPLWVESHKCCPDCSHSANPTRGDLLAALAEGVEVFAFGTTIRRCIGCGEPVTGGPTRCLGCASRTVDRPPEPRPCRTCGKVGCQPMNHAGWDPRDEGHG